MFKLERLSFMKARSSIPLLASFVIPILVVLGVINPSDAEVAEGELVTMADNLVNNAELLVANIMALWIWLERRDPSKAIGLKDD